MILHLGYQRTVDIGVCWQAEPEQRRTFTQEELKPQLRSAFKAFAAFGSGSGTSFSPAKVCWAHEATRSVTGLHNVQSSSTTLCITAFAPIIDKAHLHGLVVPADLLASTPLCLHIAVQNHVCSCALQPVLYDNNE